jgi:hypothetical protein
VRITYQNFGTRPFLIFKRQTGVIHLWIAKTEEKLREKKYVVSIAFTIIGNSEFAETGIENFVVLEPNAVYDAEVVVPVMVSRDTAAIAAGTVTPGKYVLRILVGSWFLGNKQTAKLQKRFQKYGRILTSATLSPPIELSVD